MAKVGRPKKKKADKISEAHRFALTLEDDVLARLDNEALETDRSRLGMLRWILKERYGLLKKSEDEREEDK